MLTARQTLWALVEIFGDRQDIKDGLYFIGVMVIGFFVVVAAWD